MTDDGIGAGAGTSRGALSTSAKRALAREPQPAADAERVALRNGLLIFGATRGAFRTRVREVADLCAALLFAAESGDGESPARRRPIVERPGSRGARPTWTVDVAEIAVEASPPRTRARRRLELRGAFLACGSLAAPARGYHLELAPPTPAARERLATLLRAEGLVPGTTPRGALYFKAADAVAAFLAAIGAASAVFAIEDARALRETTNRVRRLVNVEAANLDRATTAAARQRDAVEELADAFGLRDLPPPLREIARLRLEYPSDSLAELGRRCDPPIGKSSANARIASLLARAKRLAARRAASARREVPLIDRRPERNLVGAERVDDV